MNYTQGEVCPVCGTGTLTRKEITATFEYKGQSFDIPNYVIWECSACEERLVSSKDSKANGRLIRDFYRKVDGLLTADEIRRIRKFKLCKTQDEASMLLGGGGKSFARYENSEVIQNESMDNLLRILDRCPDLIRVLEQKYSLSKPVEFSFTSIMMPMEKQIKVANG
jgi:HTH-type transcriptional regulator/antitoxin MqsA